MTHADEGVVVTADLVGRSTSRADSAARARAAIWLNSARTALRPSSEPWAIGPALGVLIAAGSVALAGVLTQRWAAVSFIYLGTALTAIYTMWGPYRLRAATLIGQASGAVAGLWLGSLPSNDWTRVAVAAAVGLAAGAVGGFGRSSVAAGSMAVIGVAFGEFDTVDYGWTAQAGYYLIGSTIIAVIAFGTWPFRRVRAGHNRMARMLPKPGPELTRTTAWAPVHTTGSSFIARLVSSQGIRTLQRSLSSGSWRSAAGSGLRLAWCVAIATAVSCALHHDESHSFWILLTVVVILRPNTPIVVRTVNRLAGTLVGGLVAVLVLLTLARHGWLVAACAAVAISFAVAATPKLYALKVVGVTCSALLSASVGSVDPAFPAVRLIDTAIGAVIAIVFGHLLWPGGCQGGVAKHVGELPSPRNAAAATPSGSGPPPGPQRDGRRRRM